LAILCVSIFDFGAMRSAVNIHSQQVVSRTSKSDGVVIDYLDKIRRVRFYLLLEE